LKIEEIRTTFLCLITENKERLGMRGGGEKLKKENNHRNCFKTFYFLGACPTEKIT